MRIKNRCSPWFDRDLAEQLCLKNSTWRRARKSKSLEDWLSFRKIRNKCTQSIRKAKTEYFHEQFSLCSSNPRKFWKTVKEMENKHTSSQLPTSLVCDGTVITDKERIAELFNLHFIQTGKLADLTAPPVSPTNPLPPCNANPAPNYSFSLRDVSEKEVLEVLSKLDPKKNPGLDGLDLFKVAAPVVAEPIAQLCNLSILTAELPSA